LLVWGDRLLGRIDGWTQRFLPPEENPLAQTGRATNFALILAVISGISMLVWYSPSTQFAYSSMEAITGRTLGGWVRSMHRYSSDMAMLLMAIHALRMLFARKFTGPRWLPWLTGVFLLAVVWFIGWTGFWLVWDQPGQQVAVNSMLFMDSLPIFGEPMSRLFVADRLVPSLLFFVVFFLHMLLPLLIAVGLVLHLVRLNRVKLLPGRRLALALVAGLSLAAILLPAPLDQKARMDVKAEAFTVDAWYLTPLALTLRFGQGGLWLGMGATAAFAAVPWLLGKRTRRQRCDREETPVSPWQTVVRQARCHACNQCVEDCPYDAVKMLPRTDGKKLDARAWVDPNRCVGCGVCVGSCDSDAMSLTWFDVHAEEGRIAASMKQRLQKPEPVWLAMVAADSDGGMRRFDHSEWQRRLPGFTVEGVPTAAWVRPKFVEKLLHDGVSGVLIVRDAGREPAARDGNQWVADRFGGQRKPAFRPQRAGPAGRWQIVDFTPGADSRLQDAAQAFQSGRGEGGATAPAPQRSKISILAASALIVVLVVAAAVAPSHLRVQNPAPSAPELVFSFKALGEMQKVAALDPVEEAKKPPHMRGRSSEKPHRKPVTVRVTIDGKQSEREYRAKGIGRDGPAIDEVRETLAPGKRQVAIEILGGPDTEPLRWEGVIDAQPRRLHVVTYTPADGFRQEGADAKP
jgi:ferredoxin